jgi:lysophospholipase L1-like esterase
MIIKNFCKLALMIKRMIKSTSIKVWHYHVHIILSLVVIQLIAYLYAGLKSFTIITPLIIYSVLFVIVKHLLKYLVKTDFKKSNLQLLNFTIFSTLIFVEILLRLSGIVAVYMERRVYHYKSMYDNTYADFHIKGRLYPTELKSGFEYSFLRVPNSEGFSDKEWQIIKSDSIYRVVAIGDSFTEGDGTHSDSTWMKFLERQINDNHFDYMNAGLCGSDAVFSYYVYANKLLKYKPDLAILCINNSDIDDIIIRGGFERFNGNTISFNKAPWWEPIYAASHISRLFFRLFYDNKLIPKSEIKKKDLEAINTIQSSLLKFKILCDENNCDFVCVLHPTKYDLSESINELNAIIPFCQDNSIQYIDLYDFYIQNNVDKNMDKYYWEKDGHHNAKGYKLMSEGIYSGLLKYNIYSQN